MSMNKDLEARNAISSAKKTYVEMKRLPIGHSLLTKENRDASTSLNRLTSFVNPMIQKQKSVPAIIPKSSKSAWKDLNIKDKPLLVQPYVPTSTVNTVKRVQIKL